MINAVNNWSSNSHRRMSIFSLLSLVVLVSACQQSTYGPEADREPVTPVTNPRPSPKLVHEQVTAIEAPEVFETRMNQVRSPEILRDQVLQPLAALILSKDNLAATSLTTSDVYFRYLRLFHQSLLTIAAQAPQDPEVKNLMSRYESLILQPCARDANSCGPLKIMAKDSRYTAVILAVVTTLQPDPERRWTYTFFALDFARTKVAASMEAQIYANFESYIRSIRVDGSKESALQISEAGRRLNMVVASVGGDSPEFQKFLERLNIFDRDEVSGDTLHSWTRKSLRDSIWLGLLRHSAVRDHDLSPALKRWATTELETYKKSLIAPLSAPGAGERIWRSYHLSDPQILNPSLTFLLDQLYLGQLAREDVLLLLGQLDVKVEELLKVSEAYVRLRFVSQMLKTHQTLKTALGSSDHYKTVAELRESLLKANPTEVQWAQFLERINLLRDVMENVITTRGLESDVAIRDRMQTTFGQMDRDIKWMVTYPNMLPVMYFISKAGLSDRLSFGWVSIVITSDKIFDLLFEGHLQPWFNFTNAMTEDGTFSAPEILVAFRNALTSELFSDYGISPGSFILEAIDRILTKTSVGLEQSNVSLYRDLWVGQKFRIFQSGETNVFRRATDFCSGQSQEESLPLKSIDQSLVGHQDALFNTLSSARVYSLMLDDGNGSGSRSIQTYLDRLRTNDFYQLDMIEKMRDMYVAYLNYNHLSDDQMTLVDQKLESLHNKMRTFMGMVYFGANRYVDCALKIMDISRERQLKALQYEGLYLQKAYHDLKQVLANPELLSEVNSKYKKEFVELGLSSRDHIEYRGGQLVFIYSKTDFLLRLKDYLQKGYYDDLKKVSYPAIAPNLEILIPVNAIRDSVSEYGFLYDHSQELAIGTKPGEGQSEFLRAGYSMFYNPTGFSDYLPDTRIGPFAKWYGIYQASGFESTLGSQRIGFEGVLMKVGEVEAYDFEKEGCNPLLRETDLNKKCLTKRSWSIDRVVQIQKALLQKISISDEQQQIFRLTGIHSLYGGIRSWYDVFTSEIDGQVEGYLDPYIYMASTPALAENLKWPGTHNDLDMGRTPQREGLLDRALAYFNAFGSHNEGNLLPLDPELDGHVKDMYAGYAHKEFQLQNDLEARARAEVANGMGAIPVQLEMDSAPLVIPPMTHYNSPTVTRESLFHRSTDYIFATPSGPAQ